MSARIRLRRSDGKLFLERWGFECKRFGVFLHHIEAPDPGPDLHDHPWSFGSLVLKGGYSERRSDTRSSLILARRSEKHPVLSRGYLHERRRWSWRTLGLDECHTITEVHGSTWTLVFRGRKQNDKWGFFTSDGFVPQKDYHHDRLYDEVP